MRVGIVVADIDEYNGFAETLEAMGANCVKTVFFKEHLLNTKDYTLTAVCCGIGKVNAATATTYLVLNGAEIIINFGFSGGISGVCKGDKVVCTSFLEHDFDLTGIGYKPCEKPGQKYIYQCDANVLRLCKSLFSNVTYGPAVCGDSFICDSKKRNYLHNTFSAVSCDMETAAIASVCNIYSLPLLCIREISDDAGDNADASYKNTVENTKISIPDMVFKFLNEIKL